ncbi:MAG: coproporphyrinogen dehydrogenase HemZ [Clostridia bacterium]|nr:coproporphyrinogen dehydrogenase HemZ [Clostridia bacterium]
MISVCLQGHEFKNEIFDIIKLFYRDEEIIFADQPREDSRGIFIFSSLVENDGKVQSLLELEQDGRKFSDQRELICLNDGKKGIERKILKREFKRQLYLFLSTSLNEKMPWGMLTGIRPAKIVHEMMEKGLAQEEIFLNLKEYYMLSEEKASLAYEVASVEKGFLDRTSQEQIGIYIGIPFCPTRCLYCSFTSNPIKKYERHVENYISTLCREIKAVAEITKQKNLKIQSIYIGGGTPTSLNAEKLCSLLNSIEAGFDLSAMEEYTLEAGRPDSISKDKLIAIRNSRVDRISINPQSMNEETLKVIGRNHSPEDIVRSFELARECGIGNINMDVIAGLPGENLNMFVNTMKEIEQLKPDSLTVHTMSIKRASRLNEEREKYSLEGEKEVADMISLAQEAAVRMGMHPYYLYRQKNILGNMENVGYSKPGKESIYNIQIMEEKQTIVALGAGAITKVVYPEENRIERAFNVKSVEEYIARIDEMIERKKALLL